jgi:non-specific protein-tyrosine kinase
LGKYSKARPLLFQTGKVIMGEIVKVLEKKDAGTTGKKQSDNQCQIGEKIKVDASGWLSPQYNVSRNVILDPGVLEKNRLIGLLGESGDSDCFKIVRTQIQQRMRANGWNTLMVTSVHPGEGKTFMAINLAAMFAKEFDRTVMLVDADLRKPSIHQYLGYESRNGLADYLFGNKELRQIITWVGVEKLTVISGGKNFEQGTEILNSPRMRSLVAEMKNRYQDRYLFFDVPPVLESADAMVFSELVDAIVLVVRQGRTPMPDIRKSLEYLPANKFLGYVMNQG